MEPEDTPRGREEIAARLTEIRDRITEIDNEYAGRTLPAQQRTEWNQLNEEADGLEQLDQELAVREQVIVDRASGGDGNRESGAEFQAARPGQVRGNDIYDLTTVRELDPQRQYGELRDRALRSVESQDFPHPQADRQQVQSHVERLLGSVQTPLNDPAHFSRYLLQVGNPLYERAFDKMVTAAMKNVPPMLTVEEQRAASTTTTGGGFAIPYTLDPTIIPTGNWSVNPMRAISRIESLSGSNEWRGVSAGDLTANRRAEAAEVTDNMVTLGQPTAIVSRVDAFVPFSYEVDQDWGGFRSEMARLFQQAKDNEEATSFVTGSGTAPTPQGVITGATNVVTTVGTAAFVVADLYATKNALPPRFRPNSKYIAEQSTYDRIRQFASAAGPNVLIDNLRQGTTANAVPSPGNLDVTLLGRPAFEASAVTSVLTTGSLILCVGDFNYYLIVDRIGMSVEVIQNLFHTATNYPSGQRGLLAFWRNTGKVLSAAAFRVTKTL